MWGGNQLRHLSWYSRGRPPGDLRGVASSVCQCRAPGSMSARSVPAGGSIAHIDIGGDSCESGPTEWPVPIPAPACYSLGGGRNRPWTRRGAPPSACSVVARFASGNGNSTETGLKWPLREVAGALGLGAGDAARGIMNIAQRQHGQRHPGDNRPSGGSTHVRCTCSHSAGAGPR